MTTVPAPVVRGNTVPAVVPDPHSLLAWYDRHRRSLPWRAEPGVRPDPYRVWLSEIMLQQTTVKAVAPHFQAFLAAFPTIQDLAAAPVEEVMRRWAGLGYYARARNLHRAAQMVAGAPGGRFPDTEEGLRTLPGVGPYTAAAIAAIAFGRPAAAVDGNVERVVSRLYALEAPLPGAKPAIRRLTGALVPPERPGDFAQALMDLGATICTPKAPACVLCPWSEACAARRAGSQESYPRKAEKLARPQRRGAAFWLVRDGVDVLLRRRPAKGLLGGMAEVPGTAWKTRGVGQDETLTGAPELTGAPPWRRMPGVVRHGFTHFELELVVYAADVAADTPAPDGGWWHPLNRLDQAGLPTVMRKVAAHAAGFSSAPSSARGDRRRPRRVRPPQSEG